MLPVLFSAKSSPPIGYNALFSKKLAEIFGSFENKPYLCTRKNEKGSLELNSNIAEWSSW